VVVDVFRRPDWNAQLWSLGSAGRFSTVTGWLDDGQSTQSSAGYQRDALCPGRERVECCFFGGG
jgi:hypothetical protein